MQDNQEDKFDVFWFVKPRGLDKNARSTSGGFIGGVQTSSGPTSNPGIVVNNELSNPTPSRVCLRLSRPSDSQNLSLTHQPRCIFFGV